MPEPVLSLDDVRLTLMSNAGPVEILRGLTLAVDKGETVGLVGPSGSGKSSLLMLMGGLEQATAGRVRALGRDLTALENVAIPLELARRADAAAQAMAGLAAVGLRERAHHYPAQLSGGEQQRVALARALAPRPAILLADEPTGNLDPTTSLGIMRLLDRINRTGTTVVMATHDDEIVDQMRKRVIELVGGEMVRDQSRGVYGSDR